MTLTQEIEVYTDGSVTRAKPHGLGSAWLIRRNQKIIGAGSATVPFTANNKGWRIAAAESMAVVYAFNSLAPGQVVDLFTDCRRIQRFFEETELRSKSLKHPNMGWIAKQLSDAFNRHTIRNVTLRHDDTDLFMKEVHKQALSAAHRDFWNRQPVINHDVTAWPLMLPENAFDC